MHIGVHIWYGYFGQCHYIRLRSSVCFFFFSFLSRMLVSASLGRGRVGGKEEGVGEKEDQKGSRHDQVLVPHQR